MGSAAKPKILSKKRGLDASTQRSLTERSGEVFLLYILSHRMSEIGDFATVVGTRSGRLCSVMPSKYSTLALWLLALVFLLGLLWSLNLTAYNYWASGGPAYATS